MFSIGESDYVIRVHLRLTHSVGNSPIIFLLISSTTNYCAIALGNQGKILVFKKSLDITNSCFDSTICMQNFVVTFK